MRSRVTPAGFLCLPLRRPLQRRGRRCYARSGRWLGALLAVSWLMAARPAGAELTLLESGGAFAAGNLATVLGARPFAQREAGCCDLRTIHLNDGNYGTSWGPAEAAAGADS